MGNLGAVCLGVSGSLAGLCLVVGVSLSLLAVVPAFVVAVVTKLGLTACHFPWHAKMQPTWYHVVPLHDSWTRSLREALRLCSTPFASGSQS